MSSASALEESHSRLYSRAISFNTLSFTSPDGALTESFSIICRFKRNGNSFQDSMEQSRNYYKNSNAEKRHHLTVRLTPESGRSSDTAATNCFPYFVANKFFKCNKSGTSEHLGAENIMLAIASRSSVGQSLRVTNSGHS